MYLKQSLRLAAGVAFGVAFCHAGLINTPTLDSSVTSDGGAAGIESAINGAILAIEGAVTSPNNITVNIYFEEMSGGLGESTTGFYAETYAAYINAFVPLPRNPAN